MVNPTGIGQFDSYAYAKEFEYDFAVDGGAVGVINMRSATGGITSGALITEVDVRINTAFVAAAGTTVTFGIEAANDLQTAADPNTFTAGRDIATGWVTGQDGSIAAANVLGIANATNAGAILTTAARTPRLTVATHPLTAGKMRCVVKYVLS